MRRLPLRHLLHGPRASLRRNLIGTGAALLFLLTTAAARAQAGAPHDTSALKPPPGARVAIVEWDDLQCPACANANPIIKQAAAKYGIPWIRHDLLIPYHNWSQAAAVNARWFDTRSNALGNAYRDEVFANQTSIFNPLMLHQFTAKFAGSHGVEMPFDVDPQGKLLAAVRTDSELGLHSGVTLTPTIYVVTNSSKAPFVQVKDPDRELYHAIDQALAETASEKPQGKPAPTAHK